MNELCQNRTFSCTVVCSGTGWRDRPQVGRNCSLVYSEKGSDATVMAVASQFCALVSFCTQTLLQAVLVLLS